MPAECKIVVRVVSVAGRVRVEIGDRETFGKLKETVAAACNVSVDSVSLSHEQGDKLAPSSGDSTSLRRLGIKHGSILHLSSTTPPTITGTDINRATTLSSTSLKDANTSNTEQQQQRASSSSTTQPTPAYSSSPTPTASSTQHPGAQQDDANKKPHFTSFDQFLKERRYAIGDLALSRSFKPTPIARGRMNKLPPPVSLKRQTYRHVDHLEFMNVGDVSEFVRYWRNDCNLVSQRVGWMYGYYREDAHYDMGIRAVLEGIYEPPQTPDGETSKLLDDELKESVDLLAASLGLECIGLLFTGLPSEEPLTPAEVVRVGELQLARSTDAHFSGYPVSTFVSCKIRLSETTGDPEPFAYMMSDLAIALIRDGVISHTPGNTSELAVRDPTESEALPQILEQGKPIKQFPVSWLLIPVNNSAPKKPQSIFHSTRFPRENRETEVTPATLSAHLKACKSTIPIERNYLKFADFHLLIYVMKLFDIDTALALSDAIINKKAVDVHLDELLSTIA
eukprot:Lankesteria_metandrocarpae@DN4579_c0_g1_i1.p1